MIVMEKFPVFYAKYSYLNDINNASKVYDSYEWWIFNNKRVIVQSKLQGNNQTIGESKCVQLEIDEQNYVALLSLLDNHFPSISSNDVSENSYWEMQKYDAMGNVVCQFKGSTIDNQTLQNLTHILNRYISVMQQIEPYDNNAPITNKLPAKSAPHCTAPKQLKVLKICSNILVVALCIFGGFAFLSDYVWRAFSYNDELLKYSNVILFLSLPIPVFYLLFINLKSKYKQLFGITAATLVFVRQVFCAIRVLDVSTLACLMSAASFLLIFICIVFTKKNSTGLILCISIIPIIFSIVGVLGIHSGITQSYTVLAIISPIFIVVTLWYLTVSIKTVE